MPCTIHTNQKLTCYYVNGILIDIKRHIVDIVEAKSQTDSWQVANIGETQQLALAAVPSAESRMWDDPPPRCTSAPRLNRESDNCNAKLQMLAGAAER